MTPAQVQAEAHALRAQLDAAAEARKACAALTPRQREVLVLLSKGLTAKDVGAALGISYKSVQSHACRSFDVLNVRSMVGAAVVVAKAGLV